MIFQGIPEQIAMVTLAFVIAKIPLKWGKIILLGISLALITYVVRMFIPFGAHTLLIMIVLFLALTILGKGELSLSLIASLTSILALVIFEFASLSLLMFITNGTPETLFANPLKRTIVGEPNVLFLFITAFLLNKYTKKRVI
ncbi:hypothetical protein Desor_4007 [Desulfosporosinus orientis DSM 765]|uniref:Uncharacterized protein n=1 Tax=Desulfosporosinus orientis (strain ATCC 19365 / DSM 765 / NCIMB 8382 / VKM B-1628 / Singapore I) TaxID=768706 RepID=G7WE52_DESOD|nr:hypothetical protein Desor_4007 [Desulfosporosinus orientis DSM 765]